MGSTINYVNTVHIGSSAAVAANGTRLTALAKGQLALVNATTLTALNVAGAEGLSRGSTVYIASGNGDGTFKLSTPISGEGVDVYKGTSYVAPVQKNITVGKEGTSYDLPAESETEYTLNILIRDDQRPHGQKQTVERYNYKTNASATSGEVAFAISSLFAMKNGNGVKKEFNNRFVSLGVISSVTGGTAETEDVNAQFGSKILSYAGAPDVVEGQYLAITADDSNGTSKQYVYLVVKVDAINNVVELDTPFMQTTGLVAAADVLIRTSSAQLAGNHAFDIIGLVPSDDWNGIDEYEVVDFEASYFASGNTDLDGEEAITEVVAKLKPGAGSPYQVHDLAYDAQGYQGVNSRTRWYDNNINPDTGVNFAAGYDTITIVHKGKYLTDFQNFDNAPLSTTIVMEDGSAQATGFTAILNGFFNTVLGKGAITL
jgi:hypothetical protein